MLEAHWPTLNISASPTLAATFDPMPMTVCITPDQHWQATKLKNSTHTTVHVNQSHCR